MIFKRILFVTDKNGVEHKIRTPEDLQKILAQMTPEEYKKYQTLYRFAPIHNRTGIQFYGGIGSDLA